MAKAGSTLSFTAAAVNEQLVSEKVKVVELRTRPRPNTDTIVSSARKTHLATVVYQVTNGGSQGGEKATQIIDIVLSHLDAPVKHTDSPLSLVPLGPRLEKAYAPDCASIAADGLRIFDRSWVVAPEIQLPTLKLTLEKGAILDWVVPSGDGVKTGAILLELATEDFVMEDDGRLELVVPDRAKQSPGARTSWLFSGDEIVPTGEQNKVAVALRVAPAASDLGELQLVDHAAGAASDRPGEGRLMESPVVERVAAGLGVDRTSRSSSGPGGRVTSESAGEELAPQQAVPAAPAAPVASMPPSVGSSPRGGVTSPLVRRFATLRGVDLTTVPGTGFGGRIRRADVVAAVSAAAAALVAPGLAAPAGMGSRGVQLAGVGGAIVGNKWASLSERELRADEYEVEVGALLALQERLKLVWVGAGVRAPTIIDFVVRAVGHALIDHPMLNSTFGDGAIHLVEHVHVGLVVALPDGFVVPVVRYVDRRSLVSIAQQTHSLADAARGGTLTPPQLEGATFAVGPLGPYDVNPGNTPILGVGRVHDVVRWEGDMPHRSPMLTINLSLGHRAVDGAPAAQFLRSVGGKLARPMLLLVDCPEESS